MKLVFVSNYFNHHQKPFCDEMHRALGADFIFIATSVMREERRALGYSQQLLPDYVFLSYESEQQQEKAINMICEADVVIAGAMPNSLLRKRLKAKKLILRYSERPFKKKVSFSRKILRAIRFYFGNYGSPNVYMLCAGAYVAGDFASIGLYKNRMYQWGYYPDVKDYADNAVFSKKQHTTILWCGRFLHWKHPEDAIQLANKLKTAGYSFCINLIGIGAMQDQLSHTVQALNLSDCVHFLGAMPPEQVRIEMEQAGIFLFTSDRQEGWGAVLNEAMNSGCAVVASHAIGAVPYLLKDDKNGYIYESGNIEALYQKVAYLLEHVEKQIELGQNAYRTIVDEWNAQVAANRLLHLTEDLLEHKTPAPLFESGPCSTAKTLTIDGMKNSLNENNREQND